MDGTGLNGYEFEQALGGVEGQEACCAAVQEPKELDVTEPLNKWQQMSRIWFR